MANLNLSVEILGEFRNLTKATGGASKELQTLNGKIAGFSNKAKTAFASIGVGLSFVAIARELSDAAKAAVEDRKSQELLEDQLRKTTDANDDQLLSVDKQITKLSIMSGVADDKLRPALSALARGTKDVTEAQDLLGLALDISAGTGKDLDTVTKALTKSLGPEGTMTALEKLVPAIKGVKDPMGELGRLFDGNAKLAGDTDPYNRMNIIFGEMQEKIGKALLPALDDFTTWLASPGGTEALTLISDAIVEILNGFKDTAAWVVANKDWLVPVVTAIGVITTGWKLAEGAVKAYMAVQAIAGALGAGGAAGAVAKTGTGAGALGVLGAAAGTAGAILMIPGSSPLPGTVPSTTKTPLVGTAPPVGNPVPSNQLPGVTVNITTPVTSSTIIKTVQGFQKATGTTLAQALK